MSVLIRVAAPAAPYHEGERATQDRAGVRERADRVADGIRPGLPERARDFLRERTTVFLATRDDAGGLWASALAGPAGFLDASDEHTLRIATAPHPADPFRANAIAGAPVGLLAIDYASRRRMRVNGFFAQPHDGVWPVRVREAFGNCPKYVQHREPPAVRPPDAPGPVRSGDHLDARQTARLRRCDNFVVATAHPIRGADCSHRGGTPGFVRVEDAGRLLWPDYAGNAMFATLGNLAVDAAAGIVVPDFDDGSLLQLSGRATVLWDDPRQADFPGAERLVAFVIDRVVEHRGTFPPSWRLLDPSPVAPPARHPG